MAGLQPTMGGSINSIIVQRNILLAKFIVRHEITLNSQRSCPHRYHLLTNAWSIDLLTDAAH